MKHRHRFIASWADLRARPVLLSLALGLGLGAMTGCSLKQAAPVKATYLIDASRSGAARSGGSGILRVRPLQVAEPFDGRGFVYRTGESRYEADFYQEFLVSPRALLTAQVRRWMEASGKYQTVVDSASKADATFSLEGNVTALFGDYRDPASPQAVLQMHFLLLKEQTPAPRIVFQKSYHQAVPLEGRGPEALTKGWTKALEQVLSALEGDLPQ